MYVSDHDLVVDVISRLKSMKVSLSVKYMTDSYEI